MRLYTIFRLFLIVTFLSAAAVIFSSFLPVKNAINDGVVGVWFNEPKDARIQIYRVNNAYFGKLVWSARQIKEGKTLYDEHNPDPKLRNRPLIGLVILRDFTYDGDNVYSDGKVYDPKSGNDYSCTMTLKDSKTLNVHGYIGFSLLGRTEVFTR